MALKLVYLLPYPMWTLISALFFPILAAIATFVCFRRGKTARKLIGFFIIVPIYVALAAVICGDAGGMISNILTELKTYTVIGFMSSVCFGIVTLNFMALICGAGILKRCGALTNTIASILAFGINVFLTYSAWSFARYASFRNDNNVIEMRDALPFLNDLGFIPEVILDMGIEMAAIAILAIFIIVYFLSFIPQKSTEEMLKEDLERKRRAALAVSAEKKDSIDKSAHSFNCDEECEERCELCQHATALKSDRTKMVCDKFGVVSATHTCRKFLYDPLKRKAFRPRIDTEDQLEHIDL